MGRRKIEIKAIKDDRNRSVTFLKRKGGLFKKAHELSVLCSVDVAVIIFGHNKKLYEFSSGDIGETLTRYSYYGTPHEHKGPSDFRGKGGEDDEDDDEDEDAGVREESMPPQHMIPPHIQHTNSFPHLRQPAASASPPLQNGMFQHRHSTPQPYMGSRPSSRNTIRRTSSNLIPLQHPHSTPPPPPPQNGYAYMPNPPIYNPQANNGLQPPPQPSPQPQYQQFHPPQQSSHQQVQQAQQAFMAEQRRQSQGQLPPQERLQPPPQPTRASPQPELKPPESSPPQPRHLSSKSKSIFTPIDEGGSVLAAHFFDAPAPRSVKKEGSPERQPPRSTPSKPMPQPARTQSTTSEFAPPSRSNTNSSKSGAARPRLKVQIPSEASDDETGTGSPHGSAAASATPARGSSESHHSGVVLPPPSPSASALLSAGASGPPNPFARPPPPTNQNTNAYNDNRNNIETPISALPSRFVADGLLPSPSSFYPEWGFGRSGPDSNMLPSPLTFPTPVMATGPGFGRGEAENLGEKRKGSEERPADTKKLKI